MRSKDSRALRNITAEHDPPTGAPDLRGRPGPARFNGCAYAAAWTEFTFHNSPHRIASLHDVCQDLVHDVLLKDAEVAVTEEILFERFQFQTAIARHVADGQNPKVGQAGLGANRGQLRIVDLNFVSGKLILPGPDGRKSKVQPGLGVLVGVSRFCRHTRIVRAESQSRGPVRAPFSCFLSHVNESYILTLVNCMAEARSQISRWWLWAAAVVVLLAVFFTARYFLRERLPVRVAPVEHAMLVNTISTNGRVEPLVPYPFYSPIATTVKAVYAQEGDTVPAGKLLVVLDDLAAKAQVASAESAVSSAQSALDAVRNNGTQAERQASSGEIAQDRLTRDQAQHDLDALNKLVATGAAAPGEIVAARARLDTAQASLNAAEQSAHHRYSSGDMARAQAALTDAQAALAAAQHVESQTQIRAPITGTIYSMDATTSEFSAAGNLLLEIADLHHERVRGYFDEPDLGRLAVGQRVVIRWDAKPGVEWQGHISRLPSDVVTYTTRNVGEALIDFDGSPDGLLPDTNVTLTVTTSSLPDTLSMPREALHEQNGKYFAFKVENDELVRAPITIGTPNLTQVPILSGLEVGDTVAIGTTNGQPLQEGVPIKEER